MSYESPAPWSQLQQWLEDARSGSTEALGCLFQAHQPDLLLIAEADEEWVLRTKVDAEDLVQQVFLDAHRDWSQFRGETPPELLAWLRQILRHELANLRRWSHTQKHDVRREISLTEMNRSQEPAASPTAGDSASVTEKMENRGGASCGGGADSGTPFGRPSAGARAPHPRGSFDRRNRGIDGPLAGRRAETVVPRFGIGPAHFAPSLVAFVVGTAGFVVRRGAGLRRRKRFPLESASAPYSKLFLTGVSAHV